MDRSCNVDPSGLHTGNLHVSDFVYGRECFNAYGTDFVSEWGDVLLVTQGTQESSKNTSKNSSPAVYAHHSADATLYTASRMPYDWLCDSNQVYACDVQSFSKQDGSIYQYRGRTIDHCVAQRVENPHCQVRISITMLAVVLGCNALKATVMLLMLCIPSVSTFTVVGDAVASYLDNSDPFTENRCLTAAGDVRGRFKRPVTSSSDFTKAFQAKTPVRWYLVASRWRMCCLLVILSASLAVVITLLNDSVQAVARGLS